MLVLSGDVLLLFNPLQIDAQFDGAAAISIKEPVATGKNHGVFLNDGHDYVKCFLHKQTEERLREMGAVNKAGNVDLDTGVLTLKRTKRNKQRLVPMHTSLMIVLKKYCMAMGIVGEPNAFLFPCQTKDSSMSPTSLKDSSVSPPIL